MSEGIFFYDEYIWAEVGTMEAERLCANCKFWGEDVFGHPSSFHLCLRMESSASIPEDPDTLAFAMDQEDYHAGVLTRDDFGCVMWEVGT